MPTADGDDEGAGPLPVPSHPREPPKAPPKTLPPLPKIDKLPPPKATDAGTDPYPTGVTETFKKFDVDKSGDIDAAELQQALEALGLPTTPEQAKQLLNKYDDDKS